MDEVKQTVNAMQQGYSTTHFIVLNEIYAEIEEAIKLIEEDKKEEAITALKKTLEDIREQSQEV